MILVTTTCPINYKYKHTHSCIQTGMSRITTFRSTTDRMDGGPIILYYIILYYTILYNTILHYTIYYIIL